MTRLAGLPLALLLALASMTVVTAPAAAASGTSVTGILTGELHWTVGGSPYAFTDNVTLGADATLLVDPGVTINGNGKAFNIVGVITAEGTAVDPIVVDRVVGPTMYAGSDGSRFAWTEFRRDYSYLRPAQTGQGPLPALSHVWFNGGQGLHIFYPQSGTVTEQYTFSDARFTDGANLNGCCSAWSGSRVSVEGGTVANVLSYTLSVDITDSNILPGYSAALTTYSGNRPVNAANVWWGTTDRTTINAKITDGLDDPTKPIVALDPIREAPLDLVGPTVAISSAAVDAVAGTAMGTATDDPVGATGVASVEVSLRDSVTGEWWDGANWGASETFLPATGTASWTLALPPLTDGRQYALRAHATDVAGNPQWGTTTGAVLAEGSVPTGSFYVMSPSGDQFVNRSPVGYYMQASDSQSAVTAYKVSLDGTHWQTYPWGTNNATLEIADPAIGGTGAQGVYTLRIAWQDSAGHWSPVATQTFVYDSLAPTGTVTLNGGAVVTPSLNVPVVVDASDAYSARAMLSNDGTTWAEPTSTGGKPSWSLLAPGGSSARGDHTVSWKLVDHAGNETAPTSAVLVYDTSTPTITSPSVPAVLVPQAAGSSSASLRFNWTGSDDSGITHYEVQRSVNGGGYTALATPTSGSLTTAASYNASVRYRLRAVDHAERVSGWTYTTTVKPLLTQQTSTSITYRGTWRTSSSSSHLGGSARYATRSGGSASYRFTGRSIAWVAAKGPTRGSAKVYIDGSYVKTISLYATSTSARQVMYAKTWSSSRTHTIKIVVVGTSGHPRVDLDAFVRLQ